MAQLRRMLAIVAPHADDLRRPHRRQQRSFRQRNRLDSPRAQAFHVTVGLFGRGEQDTHDRVPPGDGLDQPVLGLTIELKSAVFHRSSI